MKSVVVTSVGDGVTCSQWEVAFRSGLLRWTEEDRFDRAALTIEFRQIEGDVAVFDGAWRCTATETGARIRFSARLDMGIPSLADALEPIAARTLVENTVAIVDGLLGEAHLVDSVIAAVEPHPQGQWHEPAQSRARGPGRVPPRARQVPLRDPARGPGEAREWRPGDLP